MTPKYLASSFASLLIAFSTASGVAPAIAASPAENAGFDSRNEAIRTGVRTIKSLAPSPKGELTLAEITDTTADGGRSHLWLLSARGKPRQLTFREGDGSGEEKSPGWDPTGKFVTYLKASEDKDALHRIALTGGAPEHLTLTASDARKVTWSADAAQTALPVVSYAFSPDGRFLALSVKANKSVPTKASKDDAFIYGALDPADRLMIVDNATGDVRPVELTARLADFRWSESQAALFVATETVSSLNGPKRTIHRVDPERLTLDTLDLPTSVQQVDMLPGNGGLVFTAECSEDTPPGSCFSLFTKNQSDGRVSDLTRGFAGSIGSAFHLSGATSVVLDVVQGTERRPARLDLKSGAMRIYDHGYPVMDLFATNAARNSWVMAVSGASRPPAIIQTANFTQRPVALSTPALVPADLGRASSQTVTWQNDGMTIEGLLYLPAVPAGTRVPLVVEAHGGPSWYFPDGYSPLAQLLVAEGWAVLRPNIRGSTGYGPAFLAANKGDLGGGDFRDLMTGIDAVAAKHAIDTDRLALIGFSYGGEMASFAAGKTDRFKALVAGAPVTNQFSEYGTENPNTANYDRWFYGDPWVNFTQAMKQSPLAYASRAKAPMLLLHGAEDQADPLGQSVEMLRALTDAGSPARLVVYPRESHADTYGSFEGLASTEPWHGTDLRRRMFAFLRAAFAGEGDPLSFAERP